MNTNNSDKNCFVALFQESGELKIGKAEVYVLKNGSYLLRFENEEICVEPNTHVKYEIERNIKSLILKIRNSIYLKERIIRNYLISSIVDCNYLNRVFSDINEYKNNKDSEITEIEAIEKGHAWVRFGINAKEAIIDNIYAHFIDCNIQQKRELYRLHNFFSTKEGCQLSIYNDFKLKVERANCTKDFYSNLYKNILVNNYKLLKFENSIA